MDCIFPISKYLSIVSEGNVADLVEDGEMSWTKPTSSGLLWPWIEGTGSHEEKPLTSNRLLQASSITISIITHSLSSPTAGPLFVCANHHVAMPASSRKYSRSQQLILSYAKL